MTGIRILGAQIAEPFGAASIHEESGNALNTQNPQTEAQQIKLDELIRVTQGAHNVLLDLKELDVDQLTTLQERYLGLAEEARTSRNPRDNTEEAKR